MLEAETCSCLEKGSLCITQHLEKGEDLEKGQCLETWQETMGQDHQDHCKQA